MNANSGAWQVAQLIPVPMFESKKRENPSFAASTLSPYLSPRAAGSESGISIW